MNQELIRLQVEGALLEQARQADMAWNEGRLRAMPALATLSAEQCETILRRIVLSTERSADVPGALLDAIRGLS